MSFHEIRFPTDLSFGALGGPERRTEIARQSGGHGIHNDVSAGRHIKCANHNA